MKPFAFVGKLAGSKSILNRTLLIQSYNPHLGVQGDSECDDVRFMKSGIAEMFQQKDIHCGSAAAVLRFLAVRASRVKGRHRLTGHPRLLARPHDELIKILRQLGVRCEITSEALIIESEGWRVQGDTLLVPSERSSQFASAVLLNAWDLPFDLYVSLGGKKVSEGYWKMSVNLAEAFGMKIDFWDSDFRVVKQQKPKGADYHVEIDMSSAFALAAIAAVSGQATFLDFPDNSIQPDASFVTILQAMGVPVHFAGATRSLKVEKATRLNGIAVNLKSTPDLFPVLAALAALAEGESDLFGAPHLIHKESDRLRRLAELISRLGRRVSVKDDGLMVHEGAIDRAQAFEFDCDHDHRLAFAAAVFKAAGVDLKILNGEVVNKSFPGFWEILGWAAP